MARNTNRVSVQGDILLKAKLQLDGATSQIDQLTKKLGTMKLSDKATKNLTAGFERINELLPNLQKQLAKGILNDEEMTIYLADTKRLTKELTKMSNTMRAMPNIAIEVDSPKLKQLTAGVESLRDKIKTTQQDFKLDAIGFPNATKEIASLTKQMKTAANAGKSVTEVYNNYSNSMKGVADILRGNTAILEQDSIASELHVENLTKQVALYERVAAALRSQRVGFSPEAKAGLNEVGIASPEVRSLVSGVRGNEKKAVVMDNAAKAAADALKQSRIEATAATNAFEESTNKLTIAETKYKEVVAFGAKNEPDMTAFDTRIAALVKSVITLEGKVKALNEELKQLEQAKLGQGAKDLDDTSNAVRNTTIGIKELTDAEKAEAAATTKSVDAFKSKIAQMFGLYNVYQLVRRGIRQAYASIKELDSAMNAIAVVTSMTTDELWGQIETYMAVAQQYGVTTKGVYEVSKLYYQQGRASAEVTLLTAETLKMAKIAGLDYSKATDNMTVALNGFKIAASEANEIVDVYAQLAATSAVSTEELAYAMSKTASIAASAGMSFKNTSVFLAQMIQTTREAPENIGTALKTIIARFSEMKKSPLELVNVEGEEVSFNRVDKALQTVGVSLKDASGQFADLDDVIYELANKWDTLDRNTQRYIATTVAGSRQQSRFLALMQDAKGLQELREEAESSEDAGLIQYAKTLDSIETKLNQLSTSFQQLYMSIINGPVVKWFLSAAKDIVDIFKDIPPTLLLFILPAMTLIIKTFLTTTVTAIITAYRGTDVKILAGTKARLAAEESMTLKMLARTGAARVAANAGGDASKIAAAAAGASTAGLDVATAGIGVTGVLKPIFTKLGTMLGALLKTLAPALAVAAGAAIAIAIADAIRKTKWRTPQERVAQHEKTLEKTNIERAAAKKDLRDLVNLKKKHDALNKVKNTSNEKQQEWIALNNEIAEKYPELISYMDDEGNYVVKLARGYDSLRESKERAYSQAALEDAQAKIKAFSDPAYVYKDMPTGGLKVGNRSFTDYLLGGLDLLGKNILQDLTHPFTRNETIWTNDSTTQRDLGKIVDAAGRSLTTEDFIKNVAPSLPLENKDPAYIKDLLDQGFVPQVGVNNWTESMVTRYKAFMNVYHSWEYKVETLDREMENIYSSMYDDFMYSQDITVESSILSGRVEKGLAKQYEAWKIQYGQDQAINKMFWERDKLIDTMLANVDYSSYDRNTKNVTQAENVRLAEAADTGGILSRRAVYDLRDNESVVKLLGSKGMTEAKEAADKILENFVDGYIQVLASADMRELDSDHTAEISELKKVFDTLPASMNDFVLASIEDIVNLDTSLEDSSLLAGTDKEALVKTFSKLAVDIGDKTGEDSDEIRAILQRTDPTTALGWAEAAYEIGKLDEELGERAKEVGQSFRVTRIDQLAIVDKYQDAMGRFADAIFKGLDFKQVLQWIEDGTFAVSDFNKTFTGFSGPDAIEKARLVMLAELDATKDLLDDVEFQALKDALDADLNKKVQESQLGLAKKLIDSIDFSTGKITIDQAAYDSLITSGAATTGQFTPTVDGFVWRGTVTTWMDVYKEMGEGSEEIAKYARDKVLDTYQELSDIFESSDAPGASQVNEWIRDGISVSHFNATWDDFKDSTSKAAVEEIVMASAEESAEILGEEYVEGAKRSRAARIIKEKAEIAKDFVSDLIGSIDFKTGAINVDDELYKKIIESNPLMSGKFTEQFDSWDFDGTLKDFITYSQAAGAEITGSGKLIADAMKDAYDSIESIFSSPEQIIKDTQVLKGFSSKMMAEVLMRATGRDGTLTKDDNELWNVDGVAAFDLLAETLAEGSVNAYAFMNHLDESYKGMQGLARLESQMNAQHIILANEAEKGTDDYWNGAIDKASAALAQMSAEYARLVFSSDTYDFMGNSLTNEKLAPMYTLMENLQGAQKTLVDASKNKGKLDIKSFHAMRDYINAGKKTSKTTTKLLDNIDTSLGPTMEVALDNDTIELLGQELNIRTREDVDTYNDAVKANNDFVDSVENSSEELSKAITFAGIPYGLGQEKTKLRDLAEAVYTSLPREESLEINRQALEYIKNGMPDEEAFATALRMSQKDDPQLAELTSIHNTIRRFAEEMGYDLDDQGKVILPDDLTQADHEKVIALTAELKTAREESAAMAEKLGRTEIKLEEVRGFLAEEIARGLVDNEASQAIITSLRENEKQNLTRIGELQEQITAKEARITALEKRLAEVIGENSEYWSEKKETGQKTQNQVSSDFAKGETQMAAVAEIERLKIAEKERLKQEQDAKDKENRIARIDRNEQDERDSNNRLERLALEKRLKDEAEAAEKERLRQEQDAKDKEVRIAEMDRKERDARDSSSELERLTLEKRLKDEAALAEELAAVAELIQPGPAPMKPAPTTPPDTQIPEITTTDFDKAKDDFEKRKAEADAKAVADAEQMAKFEEKSAEFAAKKAEIEAKAAEDAKQAEDLRRKLAISDRAKADTDEEVHYSDVELEKVEVLSKAETELNAKTAERAGIQAQLAEIYEGTEITLGRIQDDAVGANELIKNAPKEMMQEVGALLEELIKLDSSIEDLNKEIEKEKIVDITLNDADAVSAVKSLTKTETKTIIVKTLMAGTPTYMMASGGVSPGGNTLVGELGPETRVSNGKYSIVGKNGPETIGLKKDDVILNHMDTARIFGRNINATGRAYLGGTPFDKVRQEPINLENLIDLATDGKGSGKTKENTLTDFDRWYNFLNIISDVSDAINELQAARENLFGKDYTESQAREIKLLQQQSYHVERFLAAQKNYKTQLETSMIAEFGDYVTVIEGVLQVKWEALTALEDKVGEPILKAISEWDSLTDSISSSTSELEGFRAAIRAIENEMRDNYIDVEKQVIEGIKYRQQMIIDNLQKELDMKIKYDNKYLASLRDNINKERKMRDRADSAEERAKLQRRLALLQRDTSGKSDLAIAEAQRSLRGLGQSAYDQRQDDFVEAEEAALLAVQESMQNELEIQTGVLTLMNDNVQLIQETVDAIMGSGPENLAQFLANWSQEYLNSTPTNQTAMNENFTHLAGQVKGYIEYLSGNMVAAVQALNIGLTNVPVAAPDYNLGESGGSSSSGSSGTSGGGTSSGGTSGGSKTKTYTAYYYNPQTGAKYSVTSTVSQADADAAAKKKGDELVAQYAASQNKTYTGKAYSSITGLTYSGTSTRSQSEADKAAKTKRTDAEKKWKAGGGGGGGGKGAVTNMLYAEGGMVDYTGPAIVHGSKKKPEAVLNPRQTSIFQKFTGLLDTAFGQNMRAGMVQSYTSPSNSSEGGPTVVVENITLTSGVIAKDYDARRAGDLVKEEILKIAKYQGGMSIGRK